MQDAAIKKKIVLVIQNGAVLFEAPKYSDAWAFCTGFGVAGVEIYTAKKKRIWSPAKSPDTNKEK